MGPQTPVQRLILFFTRYQIPGVGPYFFQYDLIYVSTWVPNGGGPKNFFKNLDIDLPIPRLVPSHVTPPDAVVNKDILHW